MTHFILEDFLPYQLKVLSDRVSHGLAQEYRKKFQITVPEWRVLAHLSQSEKVSVREIFKRVNMDKSKVSRAASRLEASGYITKQTSDTDRRLVELSLTEEGHDIMQKLAPVAKAYQRSVLQQLDSSTAEKFTATLQQLLEAKL